MTCLKEGSPWELERGKALVILFLAQPLLSLCLTYACSLLSLVTKVSGPIHLNPFQFLSGKFLVLPKSKQKKCSFACSFSAFICFATEVCACLCFHFMCDPFLFGLGSFPLFMVALQGLVFQPPTWLMFTKSKIFTVLLFIFDGFCPRTGPPDIRIQGNVLGVAVVGDVVRGDSASLTWKTFPFCWGVPISVALLSWRSFHLPEHYQK